MDKREGLPLGTAVGPRGVDASKPLEVPLLLTFGVFAWQQFAFTRTPRLMALLLLGNDVVSMAK